MKTVLFVPTYWHSSLELFSLICEKLGNRVKKVLLETGDPHYRKFRDNYIQLNALDSYFDQMHFLEFPDNIKKNFRSFVNIIRYQKQFRRVFDLCMPDLIITTGDRNHFYPLLQHFRCTDVPIVMFQEALISVKYYVEGEKPQISNLNLKHQNNKLYGLCRSDNRSDLKKQNGVILNILKKSYYNIFGLKSLSVDYSKGWGLHDPKNYLILWGPITEELFSDHRKNIHCLGNPLIDDLYNTSFNHRKDSKLCAEVGCDMSRRTILISTPCLADVKNRSEIFFWYRSIIDTFTKYNIVLKIHPRDNIRNFESFSDYRNICIVKDKYNFRKLLRISDLSLSHYSATTIDAVAFGLPVILLPITAVEKNDCDYWFASSIFLKPNTIDSCIHFINEALTESYKKKYDSKRTEFIREMFSEHVGQSMVAAINKINELLYN